jgi:hypothetical protein
LSSIRLHLDEDTDGHALLNEMRHNELRRLLNVSEAKSAADMKDHLEFLSNWDGASGRCH